MEDTGWFYTDTLQRQENYNNLQSYSAEIADVVP